MDMARIQSEFAEAQKTFALIELRPTSDGRGQAYVRAALQTTPGRNYVLSIRFPDNYPYEMPRVYIDAPAITSYVPHRYQPGHICYLHPSMWNPGMHNLTFVIGRAAKWLAKYDVWRTNGGIWPGAEMKH